MERYIRFEDFGFLASRWKVIAIVFLLFLLILTLAQIRRHFLNWSIKGALLGIFLGFLLAFVLEGFLMVGGKTALTEILGWKNAPKPIQVAIEAGREKLVNVLGVKDEIFPLATPEKPTLEEVVKVFQSLDPAEIKRLRFLVCNP